MAYRLKITKEVLREIERLPGNMRLRVRRAIAQLTTNPKPPSSKQMEGELSAYHRLRIQDYRVIYTINEEIIQIEIVRVTRRSPRTYEDLN